MELLPQPTSQMAAHPPPTLKLENPKKGKIEKDEKYSDKVKKKIIRDECGTLSTSWSFERKKMENPKYDL